MKLKQLLPLCLFLFSLGSFAQCKVFTYNQIQSRNEVQQWGSIQTIAPQRAEFTDSEIKLQADQPYHLTVISKTDLPDKGTIYLCKDEKSNPITVMLFDNIKMYLYAKTKRFLINFQHAAATSTLADSE
ncbi:MAG: hypothetical protein U0X58_09640 [Flavobacteriaceae bacterium]